MIYSESVRWGHCVKGFLAGLLVLLPCPALAAAPGGGDAAIEDVVVTARQRAERAQEVPIALSVVGGDQLDRSLTVNIAQLSQLVPSLNHSSANPRNTAFTIRGLGSSLVAVSQANDGLEPGVGFYVDQVYHGRPATAAFDFTDIERIEVLRGPQGTLFGKNTTAGAIAIVTRAPTFEWEAQGELSLGEQGFVQGRGAVSGPLVDDRLALRLSGIVTRRDGVIRNVNSGIRHNGIGTAGVRGQLLFEADGFRLRVSADWTEFDSDCCTQGYLRVGTSLRPTARQFPALAAGFGYQPPSTDVYDRLTDIDARLRVDTNEGGISAVGEWDFGAASLTSVSAWRFWNWAAANDRDFTALRIQLVQGIPSRQDQYSQELRLASAQAARLQWVAGVYWFNQLLTGRPVSIYGPDGATWLLGSGFPANLLDGYGQDGATRITTDSLAAFGEGSLEIVPGLTLSAGLRYTQEAKRGRYDMFVQGGVPVTDPRLVAARLSVLRPQSYSAAVDDGSWSGRAILSWRATDGLLAYASAARGFKSGGINMSGLPLDAANRPVLSTAVIAPERNTTLEAGVKSQWLGDRLVLNLAAFHTEVTDFQATIVDSRETVALRGYLSNIPKVRVRGFEADGVAALFAGNQLRGSLAFADGIYGDYRQGPCPLERQGTATAACDLTGGRLAGLPRWSVTLGFEQAVRLNGRGLELVLYGDSSWRSGFFGDPTLSEVSWIDGYNVTNASVALRTATGWELALFARNLFDSRYLTNLTIQAGNSGLVLGLPGDPRLVGVTARVRI
jgi:iron complex outermembrane receptor protein